MKYDGTCGFYEFRCEEVPVKKFPVACGKRVLRVNVKHGGAIRVGQTSNVL